MVDWSKVEPGDPLWDDGLHCKECPSQIYYDAEACSCCVCMEFMGRQQKIDRVMLAEAMEELQHALIMKDKELEKEATKKIWAAYGQTKTF